MKSFLFGRSRVFKAIILILFLLIPASPVQGQQQALIPVTVTILRVIELHCDEGAGEKCPDDFYAKVNIDGQGYKKSSIVKNDDDFTPSRWIFSRKVDITKGPVISVDIKLFDQDDLSADDHIDISSGDGDNRTLNLFFDLTTGDWWGEVPLNQSFSKGSGHDSAIIAFDIAPHTDGDIDEDGIPDGIERSGILDANGNLHTNMRELGADPCRKNIAVEIDYMDGAANGHNHRPDPLAILEVVRAFDAAPVLAVPDCPFRGYPKRASGIGLIVIVDNAVREQTSLRIEEDGWEEFNNIREANFASERAPYFHYSLWAHNHSSTELKTSSGVAGGGKDFVVSLGSWGLRCVGPGVDNILQTAAGGDDEIINREGQDWVFVGPNKTCDSAAIGDDFQYQQVGTGESVYQRGTVREQAGTFMHELGHTLGLRHGGGDSTNCKPNYLSIMSYSFQMLGVRDTNLPATIDLNNDGIPDAGFRLDYSRSQLPELLESQLVEANGIGDGTDWTSWAVPHPNQADRRLWLWAPGNTPIDWNANNVIDPLPVSVDLTDRGLPKNKDCYSRPGERLKGFDDWSNLTYRAIMASGAGLELPPSGPELDYETALAIYEQTYEGLNTTDLSLSKSAVPEPVLNTDVVTNPITAVAGAHLDYVLTITNNGPNSTHEAQVIDVLPAGVKDVSADVSCVESPVRTLTCDPGLIAGYETKDIRISVLIDPDLVYKAGGPVTLTNNATIRNIAGVDLNENNNNTSVDVQVIAAADLEIADYKAVRPPSQILVGETATIKLRKVITNNGPSAPMDVSLTTNASAPPDSVITPTQINVVENALEMGEQRVIEEVYSLQCHGYSHHIFTFTTEIQPLNAADRDPDLSNNTAELRVDIECVVPIAIDVIPAQIRLRGNRVIPVLALDNRAGQYGLPLAFDASTIDPLSVRFGSYDAVWNDTGGAPEAHRKGHGHGRGLMLHFRALSTGLTADDNRVCLKGTWYDPEGIAHTFFGCTEIVIRE